MVEPIVDVSKIRSDFPILSRTVRGDKPLVYLDSAATSQKPRSVLEAERDFYETRNAAVHRGAHQLAEEATDAYESARQRIAEFVGGSAQDLVFTKNATESLNLVAYAFLNATVKAGRRADLPPGAGRFVLRPDDEIVISEMEHHANLVPWQELASKTGVRLRWFELTDDGRLDLEQIDELINARTRCVSITAQSNILGTINDVELIGRHARNVGSLMVVDACQSVPHLPVDVTTLEADLVAWSGHKMLGPTGIGCLWGRRDVLADMPPFITGGSMIKKVTMEQTTFADPPARFEAGVPMTAQAVGLAAATDYLAAIGMTTISAHEHYLTGLALAGLQEIPGVRIIGPVDNVDRGSAISFVVDGIHAHDVGQVLDDRGIAVRVGHHCAAPTCQRFGVQATVRASFAIYNDEADVGALLTGVAAAQEFFGSR